MSFFLLSCRSGEEGAITVLVCVCASVGTFHDNDHTDNINVNKCAIKCTINEYNNQIRSSTHVQSTNPSMNYGDIVCFALYCVSYLYQLLIQGHLCRVYVFVEWVFNMTI